MEETAVPRYSPTMEEDIRIFLIGDSLFTETLAQMLADAVQVQVVGTVIFPAWAETAVAQSQPHIIIVADAGQHQDITNTLLNQFPNIPIIKADLNQDYVQIITSRRVNARHADLLVAIHELAKLRD
jgi:chemotaxis response regulator CheB